MRAMSLLVPPLSSHTRRGGSRQGAWAVLEVGGQRQADSPRSKLPHPQSARSCAGPIRLVRTCVCVCVHA